MSEKKRYPLILNPHAKGERGRRVMKFVRENGERFRVHETSSREEAVNLSRRLAEAGEDVVVAAGGDGTLNAVVEGIYGTETALGIIPAGTMNVFAREMGIACGDFGGALEVIDAGRRVEVDFFGFNGKPFLQMAGVGFDAQVVEETTWERKRKWGPWAYLFSAIRVLRSELPRLRVVMPSGEEVEGVAILVGNGRLYGGQFPLFRGASNQDGLLDVIVFREGGGVFLGATLKAILRGGISREQTGESVVMFQASELLVQSDREVPVELDGDFAGRAREVRFQDTGRKLSVMVPAVPKVALGFRLLKHLSPLRD